MASLTAGENNDTTPDNSARDRIECKSLRAVLHIIDHLDNEMSIVLSENGSAACENVRSKILQVSFNIQTFQAS